MIGSTSRQFLRDSMNGVEIFGKQKLKENVHNVHVWESLPSVAQGLENSHPFQYMYASNDEQ